MIKFNILTILILTNDILLTNPNQEKSVISSAEYLILYHIRIYCSVKRMNIEFDFSDYNRLKPGKEKMEEEEGLIFCAKHSSQITFITNSKTFGDRCHNFRRHFEAILLCFICVIVV